MGFTRMVKSLVALTPVSLSERETESVTRPSMFALRARLPVPMGRSTETRALLRTSGTVNSVPSLLASVTG